MAISARFISSITKSVNTARKDSIHAVDDAFELLPDLHPIDELLGRRARLDRFGHLVARNLTAARERAARVPGQVERDLTQEGSLRAELHVVEPAGRDDERPLNLVVEIGRRNACVPERARDELDVLLDHPADARVSIHYGTPMVRALNA